MSSEWPLVSIGDIAGAMAVGPFGSRMKADLYVPSGVRVIRGNNLSGGREPEGDYVYVSEKTADSLVSCCLQPGDLVFPHRGNIGQVGITPDDGRRYMLSTSLMKLSPDRDKANPLYLMYFFKSAAGKAALLMNASQVGTPGIATPLKSLRGIRLSLPPIKDQCAIAETLSKLDDRITLLRETNATLEAIAQALFKSWFVDFDPVRAKQEGRAPEGMDEATAALFPDGFEESESGLVPRGWRVGSIYEIAKVTYGAPFASSLFKTERVGRPLIRIRDLKDESPGIYTEEIHARGHLVQPGEIVVGMDGEFRAYLWGGEPAWLNQRLCLFSPLGNASTAFVRHTLIPLLAAVEASETATTVIHLGKNDIDRFKVCIPDDRVLKAFGEIANAIYKKIVESKQAAATLTTLRDTLLPRLISGQLRLPEAESLLEEAAA